MRTGKSARQVLTFARAAHRYWLEAYPHARNELGFWRERALIIPDPVLRENALSTQRLKAANSEGAAAFAVLAPRANRRIVVRMLVAFQLLADYLDTVSEGEADDPLGNNRQLHRAIGAALGIAAERDDYYDLNPQDGDGGYIRTHVSVCREIAMALPSYESVRPPLRRLVVCYAESQCLNHTGAALGDAIQAEQTSLEIARYPELGWREVVAAGGSTLAMLALLAAAIDPGLSERGAESIVAAYYPSANSLHLMLDSLIDLALDRSAGNVNQIDHYGSQEEARERLAFLASRSPDLVARVPESELHELIVAGMAGYYLAQPEAWSGSSSAISRGVLEALGPMARWTRTVHRVSRIPRSALQPVGQRV